MKVNVLQENFSKALSLTSRFVSQKAQLPVLSNIVLKTDKTKLTLLATNLEMSITASIGAKVEQEGKIAVPARTLTDLVSNLSKGQINLSSQAEQLNIETQNLNSTLVGLNASEFPIVPEKIGVKAVNLPAKNFINALSQVIFAASIDETRPVLTGVLIYFEKGKLVLVATDGFRLSQNKIPVEVNIELGKTILPRNSLLELMRVTGESEKIALELKHTDNQVLFEVLSKAADVILTTRVIEGEFPAFERIIPKESKITVNVDKLDLLQIIKASLVLARDAANVGKLQIGDGGLSVLVESSKSGSQKARVDAKVQGGSIEILYNLRFIEEFLNVSGGEEIQMDFVDNATAGVFRDAMAPDFLHLIMPVKI